MDKPLNKAAIAKIRKYAEARYDKGWDVVVECYDDVDIQETLDQFNGNVKATIADLAVATNAGQIKTGSASRSDRIAK